MKACTTRVVQAFLWDDFFEISCPSGPPTLDDAHQDHHQGDHQQKMDQPP
jgi:hypothetical protein